MAKTRGRNRACVMAERVLVAKTAGGKRSGAFEAVMHMTTLAWHTGAIKIEARVTPTGRWTFAAKGRDGRQVFEAKGESGPLPAFETIPEELRQAVFLRDGRVCRYCAARGTPMHIDHVIPRSRGGTDDMGNLAVACAPCNLSKGDKLLSEWRVQ